MKKLICFFSVLMAATCLFAAGAKWKSQDIYHQKKFDKLIETYNLTKTYENKNVVLYKNEETSDWVYIMKEGSEENNDKRTFFVSFANLDGVFNSCSVYGGFTDFSKNVKTKKIKKGTVNKAKAKSTLSKLKRKKTYYIRARLIDKNGVATNWSKAVKIKTK